MKVIDHHGSSITSSSLDSSWVWVCRAGERGSRVRQEVTILFTFVVIKDIDDQRVSHLSPQRCPPHRKIHGKRHKRAVFPWQKKVSINSVPTLLYRQSAKGVMVILITSDATCNILKVSEKGRAQCFPGGSLPRSHRVLPLSWQLLRVGALWPPVLPPQRLSLSREPGGCKARSGRD